MHVDPRTGFRFNPNSRDNVFAAIAAHRQNQEQIELRKLNRQGSLKEAVLRAMEEQLAYGD